MSLYKHYSDYSAPWRWSHFPPKEVSCRHCGELYMDEPSLDALERLRTLWGKPIILNSAHRCRTHNSNIGGAKASQHLKIAFDCRCERHQQAEFARLALEAGFSVARAYPANGFVHLDMGPKRTW